MTITTTIILVVAIVAVAAFISYQMQRGTKTMQEFKDDYYNNKEVQESVEIVTKAVQGVVITSEEVAKPKKKRKYYPKKPKTSI